MLISFPMAGIYIHIPFCRRACHYCDFYFSTNRHNQAQVIHAMVQEMHLQQTYLPEKIIETVYIGGGTPSLIDHTLLAEIFNALYKNFSVSPHAEVTLEANPDDLTLQALSFYASLGVNRLSIGVQSFHDATLVFLNRTHSAQQAIVAYEYARAAGFNNINLDLIFAIPGQCLQEVERDVDQLVRLNPEHVSAYALTIEERTTFGRWLKKGSLIPTSEEEEASAFLLVADALTAAGYTHYEISNYAKPAFQSRHNSNYWKQIPYLGIGPSAHSFNGVSRQANVAHKYRYIEHINRGIVPATVEPLSLPDRINEYILTGLRTSAGIDLDYLQRFFSYPLNSRQLSYIEQCQQLGYAKALNNRLWLTRTGMLLADRIAAELFIVKD